MKKDGIQTRKRKPKNLAKNKNSSKQEPNGNYLSFHLEMLHYWQINNVYPPKTVKKGVRTVC